MTCSLCSEPDVVSFDYGPLCKECFIRNVERRVRKQLRGCLVAGQKVMIVDNGSGVAEIMRFFLKRTGLPLSFVDGNADLVLECSSADDESAAYLEAIIDGKVIVNKGIQPLVSLMREEVVALGRILSILLKDKELSGFEKSFELLTKKDGAVRFGVLASRQKLEYA